MILSLETTLMTHLTHLAAEIGPRPTGSPGNRAAEAYITEKFRGAGLDTSALRFDWPDWRCDETRLEVGGDVLTASANPFSAPCDLAAPLVGISTIRELESADLSGQIAVITGDLGREALLPKAYTVYTSERSQRIVGLLEAKRPAAILSVSARYGESDPLTADADLPIPAASAPPEVGLRLLEHLGETVHLKIDARRTPSHSATVIGTAGPESPRLVLCAHYDTKFGTPGALDNASGVAALLALADLLGRRKLGVGLEFIAFTDEEYAGHDDSEYMRYRGDLLPGALAAINMDGIGPRLGTNTIMIAAHSAAFEQEVARRVEQYPGMVWVEPWPASNHSTFAWRGVPSVAFSSVGGKPLPHTADDTVDWISAARLVEVVSLVVEIVEMLADKPLGWTRTAAE